MADTPDEAPPPEPVIDKDQMIADLRQEQQQLRQKLADSEALVGMLKTPKKVKDGLKKVKDGLKKDGSPDLRQAKGKALAAAGGQRTRQFLGKITVKQGEDLNEYQRQWKFFTKNPDETVCPPKGRKRQTNGGVDTNKITVKHKDNPVEYARQWMFFKKNPGAGRGACPPKTFGSTDEGDEEETTESSCDEEETTESSCDEEDEEDEEHEEEPSPEPTA